MSFPSPQLAAGVAVIFVGNPGALKWKHIPGQFITTKPPRWAANMVVKRYRKSPTNFTGNLGEGEILFHLARYMVVEPGEKHPHFQS